MSKSTPVALGEQITLKIERLSLGGGRGVGRIKGFVVFVPLTLPGEKVTAKIASVKKSFAIGELIEVLEAAPERIIPPCPYYGQCGGCNFQHTHYDNQLKLKTELLRNQFARKFTGTDLVKPIVPSPQPFHYRNRVQIHKKGQNLGFHHRQSNDIVNIESCKITESPINSFFQSQRDLLPDGRSEIFLDHDLNVQVRSNAAPLDIDNFSQVNRWQNELIKTKLASKLATLSVSQAYDLYCGGGNFTSVLEECLPKVPIIGVELAESSSQRAKNKFTDPRVQIINQNVDDFLAEQDIFVDGTLAIVDPPRSGLNTAGRNQLRRLAPSWLIYISCNPSTLERDLLDLCKDGLFAVESIVPFDMFPQTDHIELMTFVYRP